MNDNPPLPRLSEQCIRNNFATALRDYSLEGWLQWGLDEFFELWGAGGILYDEEGTYYLYPLSTYSQNERDAIQPLVEILNRASSATFNLVTVESFLATKWPDLIEAAARSAYIVMSERGRFSEEKEELEPSGRFEPSPYLS